MSVRNRKQYGRARALAGLTLAIVGACSRKANPAPPAELPPATEVAEQEARQLALQPVEGVGVVDARIARLQAACRARPEIADTWVRLGQYWIRKARLSSDPGYYLNARASAELALALSEDHPGALNLQTMLLLHQHRFEEARAMAARIAQRDHADTTALGNLADALLELGRLDEAQQAVQRMLEIKPGLSSYARISYLAWLRGNERAALDSIRLGIDAAGASTDTEPRAWALVQAADIFWHTGDYDGARAGYQMALEVLSDYPPAELGLGRVALAHQQPLAAIRHFEAALAQAPSVEALDLLEQAQLSAGQADLTANIVHRAERAGRTDMRGLSLYYSNRNVKPTQALELARRERARRADIYTEDALAWALYRKGKLDQALRASKRAARLGTPDARLLFHRGAILLASGARESGRKLLQEALTRNPHFDVLGVTEAQKLLHDSENG